MKKTFLSIVLLIPFLLTAQTNEGIIRYQETIKLDIQLPPEMQQYASMIPNEEKTDMDLVFTSKESLYKKSEKVEQATSDPFEDGNVNVQKVIIGGAGSVVSYYNLEDGSGVKSEDLMGKKFLIESERKKIDWRMLGEQKEIAGYTCMNASYVKDSTTITAWFTPQIPLSIGPSALYGLPGAILQVDFMQGRSEVNILANEVLFQKLEKPIEKPSKGKKVTEDEFDAIVEKQMAEMEEMRGGEGKSTSDGNVKIKVIRN